ncbi:MAG: hypothetical protein JXM69_13350, partial [Anaerolineae bacterium]|nr:hypothetical protein [Anaerolineae bacterium]
STTTPALIQKFYFLLNFLVSALVCANLTLLYSTALKSNKILCGFVLFYDAVEYNDIECLCRIEHLTGFKNLSGVAPSE